MIDAVNSLIANINSIVSMFGSTYIHVKYHLFKSFAMSLYGSVLNFNDNMMNQIYVTWCKCIRCLFNISNLTHSRLLPLMCDDLPVHLYKCFNKFIFSIFKTSNSLVKLCCQLINVAACSMSARLSGP